MEDRSSQRLRTPVTENDPFEAWQLMRTHPR